MTAEKVAVVVVTYNRADLLERMLAGLDALERRPEAVIVVDNASTDHTREVLERSPNPDLLAIHTTENLGGAGGFHLGLKTAYDKGYDVMWLMDDDVVPAPDCLTRLLEVDGSCLTAVREDRAGALVEKAAVHFDLRNPLAIRPKKASVDSAYADRASMPATVPVDNVSFEGFLVRRAVIDAVGLPDPSYFIFYDDVDYALRARRAGFPVVAVRDAVLVRQLAFDQQHDMRSWKGFFMYRNLFVVHLRYGENALVRLKPWLIALVVLVLALARGRRDEAGNVLRAIRSAPGLARTAPPGPPNGLAPIDSPNA